MNTTATPSAHARLADDARPDPPSGDFYRELIMRNSGLVAAADQELLRRTVILVAGCGSVGGAAVEPLVRLGAEHLLLVEPGTYDLSNLNRQRAGVADLGTNKAVVLARRAREINPFANVAVDTDGVTDGNVVSLVDGAGLIVDGIDVTVTEAVRLKVALHVAAAARGVPVISGYDVAGVQALLVYDYRAPAISPLHGRIGSEEAGTVTPLQFLARVVPRSAIPLEIVPELLRQVAGTSEGFPQLVYAADLFGVLAARATVELLAGRRVRSPVVVDVHQVLRPTSHRFKATVLRAAALIRLQRQIFQARRGSIVIAAAT